MNIRISAINPAHNLLKTAVPFKSQNDTAKSNLLREPKNDTFEMSIGYVNDTHGQTNNMMRILSGIKGDLRLSAGDNDIGDEKNTAVHKATYKFLNLAGVKATALGNHELDTTQADLMNSLKDYDGDVLVVNLDKEDIEDQDLQEVKQYGRAPLEEVLKTSKVVEIKGEKIGILGASPSDIFDRLTHIKYHTDCKVADLDETIDDIQEEVNKLKSQGVNKIVLLSHLGHKRDQEVAKNTEGIDVIIGGHTHELVEGTEEGKNLFYSKTGEWRRIHAI